MRWSAHTAAVLALIGMAGCTSARKRAFERVAEELNPIVSEMRPFVSLSKSTNVDDPSAQRPLIAACFAAADILWNLDHVRFPAEIVSHEHFYPDVTFLASNLLDYWAPHCRDLESHPTRVDRCAHWCKENVSGIERELSVLRKDASVEGVEIAAISD